MRAIAGFLSLAATIGIYLVAWQNSSTLQPARFQTPAWIDATL